MTDACSHQVLGFEDETCAALTPSTVDRVLKGLVWWWAASPAILMFPLLCHLVGLPDVRAKAGVSFGLTGLISAGVAPAVGFTVAHLTERRAARRRFVAMGVVSAVPILFFLVFGVLYTECTPGEHC